MLPVKTRAPLKASEQTTAAASKIKNKILNTSSFFKVSLKNNNKALACALEAQKRRSRQLEEEIVHLQKQVEELIFELATRKYKDRKMVLIWESLHKNTLLHFDMVSDLYSDGDLFKPPEDDGGGDAMKNGPALSRLTEQVPPQPEMSNLLCPDENKTVDLPAKNLDGEVFSIQGGSATTTDISSDKRLSSQLSEPLQTQTPRHSTSLREKVNRMSAMFSQSGLDMKSDLCPQNTQTSTCENPTLADNLSSPSASLQHWKEQEKTLLLNTTMEMTQSDAADIVTVETRAKKPGRCGRSKDQSSKKERPGSSAENSTLNEVHSGSTGSVVQAEDINTLDAVRPPLSQTLCRNITSRIPKLGQAKAGNSQKTAKSKLKSCDQTKSKSPDAVTDADGVFTDPDFKLKSTENVIISPAAEEALSKVTCSRSRTRGRSPVTRETLGNSSFYESENSEWKWEEPCNEEGRVEKHGACESPKQPGKFRLRADEAAHPESEHGRLLFSEVGIMADPRGTRKPNCRETFVISVDRTPPHSATPELAETEPDFLPRAGSYRGAERSAGLVDRSFVSQRSDSGPLSCKRTWLAAQDSESFKADAHSDSNHDELLLFEEVQKNKKARREEKSRSSKRKVLAREGCRDVSSDEKKRTKRSNCKNRRLTSEGQVPEVQDPRDPPRLCGVELERYTDQKEELGEADSHSDVTDTFVYESKPRRKKSTLQTRAETRNPRETFVVYETRDSTAVHQNLGDVLVDEVPPWLDADVSVANTETDSFLMSPTRATPSRGAGPQRSSSVPTAASPAGRVLTSLTNTLTEAEGASRGRARRGNCVVSYKEPPLNSKIRRGDKFTDSMFTPVLKDGKKKKKKRQKTVKEAPVKTSISTD